MEEILKSSNKIIIDKGAEGGNGVMPYLPLPSLPGFPAQGGAASGNHPAAAPAQTPSGQPSTGRRP
jgi:hypothetical protein